MAGSETPEQEGTGDILERDSSSWNRDGPRIHQYGWRKTKSVSLSQTAILKIDISVITLVVLSC